MSVMKRIEVKPLEGRTCGSCNLCCKVYAIDWLEVPKPAGKWCHHCKPGVGCAIWETIPEGCAKYYCHWRMDAGLDDSWRPDRARFILAQAHPDDPLTVILDPGAPQAHRREPYWSRLVQTAQAILEGKGSTIVIFRGKKRALLFPDGEVDVPDGLPLNAIKIDHFEGPQGKFWRARFSEAA